MTAKEYLMQARKLQARINELEQAKLTAWERATSTTGGGMPVQGGETSRKTESYSMLVANLDAEYARLTELKADIAGTISKVRDNTLATLLIGFYINGKTWEQLAYEMNYSYYHMTHDLHARALRVVERIINESSV